MLGVVFWMYGGYVWLTNVIGVDGADRRVLLLGGMSGSLVAALAIPGAFDGDGAAFGAGYAVVIGVHTLLFVRASAGDSRRGIVSIAPFNLLSAALVPAGGIAGGTAEYVLWALALALQWAAPFLARVEAVQVAAGHFVERYGLVVNRRDRRVDRRDRDRRRGARRRRRARRRRGARAAAQRVPVVDVPRRRRRTGRARAGGGLAGRGARGSGPRRTPTATSGCCSASSLSPPG